MLMITLLSELSFDFYMGFNVDKADWVPKTVYPRWTYWF